MISLAIAGGEPMKSCFSFNTLEDMLARHGFLIYEHLSPKDIDTQIIKKRERMKAFEHIHYILAVKKV